MAVLGIAKEEIEKWRKQQEPATIPVYRCNWRALQLFLELATQWRYAGMSGEIIGLDYPAVRALFQLNGIRKTRKLFAQIQTLERAALAASRSKK